LAGNWFGVTAYTPLPPEPALDGAVNGPVVSPLAK
jgi:hypothetical protein